MRIFKPRAVRVVTAASLMARLKLVLPALSSVERGRAAPPDGADTRLARAVAPAAEAHPGLSGVFPLPDGKDAFAVRGLLADAAERTLDVQYYIWRRDMSGTLLFDALLRAADRGVHVRLLLDDNDTVGMDPLLAALDAHPGIEVRLFNPFRFRNWRRLNYLTEFARLNRRMHNKSFTADGQVTVIGGRNIGDEYFGAGHGTMFLDLDAMAIGPVVNDVSRDFDRYWTCGSSYPAARVIGAATPGSVQALKTAAGRVESSPAALDFIRAIARQPFVRELLEGRLSFEWTCVRMISDDPAKGLGLAAEDALLPQQLMEVLGEPRRELCLVSPYFVPMQTGVDYFSRLAGLGIKVTVLTNSLDATDVAAVHAGYAKRRRPLLKAGIALLELKRVSALRGPRGRWISGSYGSSLHAKTFSVDRKRVFVGSFNFDPRSARLNTEMGFLIDSPDLAEKMTEDVAAFALGRAYGVRLSPGGRLQWVENTGGREVVHRKEPGAPFRRRLAVAIMDHLPIEWLL